MKRSGLEEEVKEGQEEEEEKIEEVEEELEVKNEKPTLELLLPPSPSTSTSST